MARWRVAYVGADGVTHHTVVNVEETHQSAEAVRRALESGQVANASFKRGVILVVERWTEGEAQ